MTRSNNSRAASMKQARRSHRRQRRLRIWAKALLITASAGDVSPAPSVEQPGDYERQQLAHLASMLHRINSTNTWSREASRFMSAYSSGDQASMERLMEEKEAEVQLLKLKNMRDGDRARSPPRRRLMDLALHDVNESSSAGEESDQSEKHLRGLRRKHSIPNNESYIQPEASTLNEDRTRELRAVGTTRTSTTGTRTKAKTINNSITRVSYGSGSTTGGYSNNASTNNNNNNNVLRQYFPSNYYPDPYYAKAYKAAKYYQQPTQPLSLVNGEGYYNGNYGGNYIDFGGGYYNYNDRNYYYSTPVECCYPDNTAYVNTISYSQYSTRDNQPMVRRRQPQENFIRNRYSSQNRYEDNDQYHNNRYRGHNRNLQSYYVPLDYFNSFDAKAGKGGKSSKSSLYHAPQQGLRYQSAKAAKAQYRGVIILYPFHEMYNIICGAPPLDDGYPLVDDGYQEDDYPPDTMKPNPQPSKPKPTKKPTKPTKKPTKPSNNKPTPEEDDAVNIEVDDETAEVRCPDGCPDCEPDSPLPCPPPEMKKLCDKHNKEGNFIDCYQMCKPSFCCIHDSGSKTYSPSCADEYDNCPLYYPCYIIWWKLSDTIGPATYLRVEQDEPFYNVDFSYLEKDWAKDQPFFQQLFGHHFDGDDSPTDDVFENEENW